MFTWLAEADPLFFTVMVSNVCPFVVLPEMCCVIRRSGCPAAFAVAAETRVVAPIAEPAAIVAAASRAKRLRLGFEVVCIGFLPVGHGQLDRAARREGRGAGGGPTTGR